MSLVSYIFHYISIRYEWDSFCVGYQTNRRYSYNYNGWVAHGVAEALEKDLALKITAKAHLDFLNNGDTRMTVG